MGETVWKGEIPDHINFDILKRLPAKSLMRFKCVCKTWRAIIEDPSFAEQHHVESKSRRDASYILLFLHEARTYCTYKKSIVPLNYSAVSTTDIAWHIFAKYNLCTYVVEGLACIIDENGALSALNVTTGEKLRLPPGVKRRYDFLKSYRYPVYFLGFDPLTKNYKLLSFRLEKKSEGCEILTLGENSWREIDLLGDHEYLTPKAKFRRKQRGVSVHGAIYWIRGESVIRYFDVHAEKFMQLDLPHGVGRIFQLTRLGNRLGLFCMGTEGIVLWTLSPTKVWKMQEMPYLWNLIDENEIIGTTRTGAFLLRPKKYGPIGITSHDPSTSNEHGISFLSYEPTPYSEEKMLIKITHSWINSSDTWLFGATCDHLENILPLKNLFISSADGKG